MKLIRIPGPFHGGGAAVEAVQATPAIQVPLG
jgi:hypothetical protein